MGPVFLSLDEILEIHEQQFSDMAGLQGFAILLDLNRL